LKYARSALDYTVGGNLYMLPSDMRLGKLDRVYDGYNDKLVIASTSVLGKTQKVVEVKIPQKQISQQISQKEVKIPPKEVKIPQKIMQKISIISRPDHIHENEKHGLIMGLAGVLLLAFWCFK
jgi:hypothetical protein